MLVVFASFPAQKVAGAVTVALLVLCLCAGSICWCAGSGCSARFVGAGNVQANCTAVEGVTRA